MFDGPGQRFTPSGFSATRTRVPVTQISLFLRRREDWPLVAAFVVVVGILIYKSAFLVFPDLAFTYPYVSSDSYQWVADGLADAGYDVSMTYRNPGLPLVLAALYRLGIPNYLPVLTSALLLLFVTYLALILREQQFSPGIIALTILFFFFNFSIQSFFDYIYADQWAVTFQLAALYHLHQAIRRPRHLLVFALWAGLSLLFQYAVAFLFPCVLLYFATDLWPRRESTRRFGLLLLGSAGICAAILLPHFLYRWIKFGTPLHSHVVHFPLVRFHFFGGFYYFVNFFAFLGIPVALLTLYGLWKSLRDDGLPRLLLLCTLSYFVFWVLLYTWHDVRFLLYAVPFFAFFFARALRELGALEWFSPRTASLQQLILAYGAGPLLLLYGLHVKESAHTPNELALTPQNILVFSLERITGWEGNVTINMRDLHLRNVADRLPSFEFFQRYRAKRKGIDARSDLERRELETISALGQAAGGETYRIELCGRLPHDEHETILRRIALRRETQPCTGKERFSLYGAGDETPAGKVAFAGQAYKLVER
jgi:hypothetical protein